VKEMKRLIKPWTATGLVLAAMLGNSLWLWDRLPGEIPVHFGIDFQPDGYASRTVGVLIIPGVILGLSVLLSLLTVVEPRRKNLKSSEKAVGNIWIGLVVAFAIMHSGTLFTAAGVFDGLWMVPFSLGLMLAVAGNYFGKIRSNFFIGIRTPWTLSSELAWERTHRLGGRLFVTLGVLLMLAAPFGPGPLGPLLFAGLMTVALVTAGYSFVVWRNDPARAGHDLN
jgi:uncharacterized membrane protein